MFFTKDWTNSISTCTNMHLPFPYSFCTSSACLKVKDNIFRDLCFASTINSHMLLLILLLADLQARHTMLNEYLYTKLIIYFACEIEFYYSHI